MRIIIFSLLFFLMSCGSDSKSESSNSDSKSETISNESISNLPPKPEDPTKLKYKKTVKGSEFAVYKTTSVHEGNREYYFKTLDGISLRFDIPLEGKNDAKIPAYLLEDAKYQTGHAGANGDMAGRVFELIYNKDNDIGEIKLAEVE